MPRPATGRLRLLPHSQIPLRPHASPAPCQPGPGQGLDALARAPDPGAGGAGRRQRHPDGPP